MPKISPPTRGQPIDVAYMYEVANAINDLAKQVSPSTNKQVTVDTKDNGVQNVRAAESKIIAGYLEIVSNTNMNATTSLEYAYSFPTGNFKYAPIVTVSPVNIGNTPAGKNVSVVIKDVSTSLVTIVVTFNTTGTMTLGLNIIAVGIPN